jgi:very-short-patch-repair endonuclease
VDVKAVDAQFNRLAAGQHSLAHRNQALALGMTARQVDERVASGLLVPAQRAVYRLAGAPQTCEQAVMAACMAAGGGAVASHRSAGALWGLRGVEAEDPEIIVPATRCPTLRSVRVHRTRTLDPIDVSRRLRIPVTTPARTLLDLGAVAPVEVVESALEDALMRRLVTFQLLTNTLARLGGPGRNGAGVLRALVEERDPATAPTQSVLEDELGRLLRQGGLPEPVRQYRVGSVFLDYAYPPVKLGVEADSRIWHGGRLDVQRNSDKDNVLVAHGWRVLHFSAADIRRRAQYVLGEVGRELVLACPA